MTDIVNPGPRPKGSKIMWAIVAGLLALALAGGVAAVVVYQLHLGKSAFAAALTVVGLSLEGATWATAAPGGVGVFEARQRIWRFLTGKGWTKA